LAADRIIYEANYRRDMVRLAIRTAWDALSRQAQTYTGTSWGPPPRLAPVHSRPGKLPPAEPNPQPLTEDRLLLAAPPPHLEPAPARRRPHPPRRAPTRPRSRMAHMATHRYVVTRPDRRVSTPGVRAAARPWRLSSRILTRRPPTRTHQSVHTHPPPDPTVTTTRSPPSPVLFVIKTQGPGGA